MAGMKIMSIRNEQGIKVRKWQMSEGLMNAGLSGGVVRKLEFTKVVLH